MFIFKYKYIYFQSSKTSFYTMLLSYRPPFFKKSLFSFLWKYYMIRFSLCIEWPQLFGFWGCRALHVKIPLFCSMPPSYWYIRAFFILVQIICKNVEWDRAKERIFYNETPS